MKKLLLIACVCLMCLPAMADERIEDGVPIVCSPVETVEPSTQQYCVKLNSDGGVSIRLDCIATIGVYDSSYTSIGKYLFIVGTTDREFASPSHSDYIAWHAIDRENNLDCPNLLKIENGIATLNPQKLGFLLMGQGEQRTLKVSLGMMSSLTQEQLDNIQTEIDKL